MWANDDTKEKGILDNGEETPDEARSTQNIYAIKYEVEIHLSTLAYWILTNRLRSGGFRTASFSPHSFMFMKCKANTREGSRCSRESVILGFCMSHYFIEFYQETAHTTCFNKKQENMIKI